MLQDTESFEKMKAAIAILKLVAQGEQDIREGHWVDHDALFDDIEQDLSKLQKTSSLID